MAKKPDERYSSAGDMAMAATQALTELDKGQAETIVQRSEAATTPAAGRPGRHHGRTATPSLAPRDRRLRCRPARRHPVYAPAASITPARRVVPCNPAADSVRRDAHARRYAASLCHGATAVRIHWPAATSARAPGRRNGVDSAATSRLETAGRQEGPVDPIAAIVGVSCWRRRHRRRMAFGSRRQQSGRRPTTSSKPPRSQRRRDPGRSPTSDEPTPAPTRIRSATKLMALIPSGYPTSVCEVADKPSSGALVTIDCKKSVQPNGPESAQILPLRDAGQLKQTSTSMLGEYDEISVARAASRFAHRLALQETPDDVAWPGGMRLLQGQGRHPVERTR